MLTSRGVLSLAVLIISTNGFSSESNTEEEIKTTFQKGFTSSIKNYLPTVLNTVTKQISLEKEKHLRDGTNAGLNSTIITKAVQNLLSDTIPVFPFAIAEPTVSNILIFFGILNSTFQSDLLDNQVNVEASINNTNQTSAIVININSNSSSLQGHYELDVSSYEMHLYGDGNYSLNTNNTNVAIKITIEIFENNSFLMSNFLMDLKVKSAQLMMSNLLDGGPAALPLLNLIQQLIPMEVATLDPMIQHTVNSTITDFTNDVLAKIFTWDEIVWLIQFLAGL